MNARMQTAAPPEAAHAELLAARGAGASDLPPWSAEEFEALLREKGTSYHIYHPFHVMMAEGKLTRSQLQGWVANRFYYQIAIPVKDAAILSNCSDREIRREWIQRILDHDGYAQLGDGGGSQDPGGIEAWIRLGEAVGLTRDDVTSLRYVAPAARFAVDAYINFARQRPWQEAVASSLTELFAPHIHQQRIDTWPTQYRGSTPPACSTSGTASPRQGATSSTACASPSTTSARAVRCSNARSTSCSSSSTCCGRWPMRSC